MSDKSNAQKAKPKIPQVDLVLRQKELEELTETIDRKYLTYFVRKEIDSVRKAIFDKGSNENGKDISVTESSIAKNVVKRVERFFSSGLSPVINGTGVVLNTNLGRSPLPKEVLEEMVTIGLGYSSLEIDVKTGKRGERTKKISQLLEILTGCEAAIVVNNCAAAVMLVVAALANKKEVVVSRSELVEIGGSFRLPDVIESAGGFLKEVGTTNKTRASDFGNATNDNTGLYMRCHRSNFALIGFTEDASNEELVKIAKANNVPLVDDLGSGAFYDISKFGLKEEPTVKSVIETGVDVVTFSGDKLLGGPQAGIIAGSKKYVEKIRKCPMYRALRADKMILSLIENTLSLYLHPSPEKKLPTMMLSMVPLEELKDRVTTMIEKFDSSVTSVLDLKLVETESTMGGGSLPGETLKSFGLQIASKSEEISANKIAASLRDNLPPIIAKTQKEVVVIDFRTIFPRDEAQIQSAIERISRDKIN